MSGVNGVGASDNNYWDDHKIKDNQEKMDVENISVFYTTNLTEDRRSDFENTFKSADVNENQQGARFLEGLVENKADLMEELGISEEEYDNLACIAMALATQETGMGREDGYDSENNGLGKWFRDTLKNVESWINPSGSESSGLTQIKIYDFLNGDKLTAEQKEILYYHGVSAESITSDNLYSNPDKAAVATMVVLDSLAKNFYPQYLDKLEQEHKELESKIDPAQIERGQEDLDKIMEVYENSDSKTQQKIRVALKQWMLSVNGSKDGFFVFDKTYNEEHNLNELNKLLKLDTPLVQEDLDYIRYTLSGDDAKMNTTQYCAYAWNNGTGTTGMQFDRLLSAKIGTIYTTPEIFDYDQFVYNVETIAKKYARQMMGE